MALAHPIKDGKITTTYGKKGKSWSLGYHTGVDYAVPIGTDVFAVCDGQVTKANWGAAYGIQIVQKISDNEFCIYAHLSKSLVKPEEKVVKGQLIGKTGNTGNSTGPHLHFETRNNVRWSAGKAFDPKVVLKIL